MHLTWGDSLKTVPVFFEQHPDVVCDILHVDGLHTHEGVRVDLKNFHDHLAKDAVILVDDQADLHVPVVEYVRKYGLGMECFMFTDNADASKGFCAVQRK